MSITFRVDSARVEQAMQRAPGEINAALQEAVTFSAADFEAAVVDHTPVGATGHLRQSITHDVQGRGADIVGRVYSQDQPVKVASVETGRRAGRMPPRAAIALWVHRKLGTSDPGVVFLVQRAIGRRGTKGARMFQRGYQQALPRVNARVDALRRRIEAVLR